MLSDKIVNILIYLNLQGEGIDVLVRADMVIFSLWVIGIIIFSISIVYLTEKF